MAKFDEREMKIPGNDMAMEKDTAAGGGTKPAIDSAAPAADCRPRLDSGAKDKNATIPSPARTIGKDSANVFQYEAKSCPDRPAQHRTEKDSPN